MSLIESHEKVPIETMIMTATSEAIGMIAQSGPSTSNRNSVKTPDTKVESRVSPPAFTVMIDWQFMAHYRKRTRLNSRHTFDSRMSSYDRKKKDHQKMNKT